MCGIVGMVLTDSNSVKGELLPALKRLEYRGYDSCGYALTSGNINKGIGKISDFMNSIEDESFHSGVAHCRWATHGGKTWENAHPHTNANGTIFAVHNGIIENYQEMRGQLENKGYVFKSATDSEIIPHYFDNAIKNGFTPEQTIQSFFKDAQGTFAVILLFKGKNTLYAFKKDSPLVIGVGDRFNIVASDIYAFNNKTINAVFIDDGEYAVVTNEGYECYNKDGAQIRKTVTKVEAEAESTTGNYPHFTIKEIKEQPITTRRVIRSLFNEQLADMQHLTSLVRESENIVFIGCGTSYHASLVGGSVLSRMGYNIHNVIASEFDTFYKVNDKTLIIALSQSGETMDVVTVIKEAKKKGAKIASVVNVPFSTIQRESDVSVNILAGQEVAVASTKAFTNQVLVLLQLGKMLDESLEIDLNIIPQKIQQTIDSCEIHIQDIAKELAPYEHLFFLGRGAQYPVSREMALKVKEISYIHAEGMMAGELKHGTIALIDPNIRTPVVCLIPNNDSHMLSSIREVEARGAWTILVTNGEQGIHVPSSNGMDFALYATIVGQLLAYYVAVERGCDVDQPRNLAKSVTVH